ncbi:MAG TPA: ATP-binding protein, partial [Verrucomicrobiae bacterium]|nr:ATP-binding protein [Verrucomicrobiae bacterium]
MKAPLHIIHVEDNPYDADLARALLNNAGIACEATCVKTPEELQEALNRPELDLILSDFSMPKFDGLSALRMSRKSRPEVPFIFLSGTIGEEVAIESIKEGATDYVIKDRMSRLPFCVRRAVREAAEASERRRMEERIREQAALLDRAQDAICLNDMSQQILFWNRSAERLYGWKAWEAMGRNCNQLLFQDDLTAPSEALRNLIRKGEWQGELHQITKDRRRIIVESRWTLLRNEGGEPKSILIINTDITEKKQIEAQFLRTQRLETIGALAGGIAHDLNNALTPILMAGSLLRKELPTGDGARLLEMMIGSAQRGAEMVKQILSFSRGVGGTPVPLQVQSLVNEMAQLARKTFSRSIKIEANIAEDLPEVTGNATQLHQVLLNLCVNARDAMPQGGTLTIETSSITLKGATLPDGRRSDPGVYVLIKVSDTGHGIPPEIREKIFEPFFTTKEMGNGTGLGLSTVMGIVKTHGGFLDLTSQVGQGTTFKVYLPSK